MSDRYAYELRILKDRIFVESITLEDLVAIPVVGTPEDPRHTVYDGHLVLFHAELGVLCRGSLTLEILGPYWDRIFRIEFSGVQVTQATDSQLLRGVDVKQVFLSESQNGRKIFSMTEMFDEGTISLEFESATVMHFSLRNCLERSDGGRQTETLD